MTLGFGNLGMWTESAAGLAVVEQKDAAGALVAAAVTLAGFSLVFLGFVLTRPITAAQKASRREFRMIATLLILFWMDLLSAGCGLGWFYFNAPGSLRIPIVGRISPGLLYQAGWLLFWLTALLSYYVVIAAILTVRRSDAPTPSRPTDLP